MTSPSVIIKDSSTMKKNQRNHQQVWLNKLYLLTFARLVSCWPFPENSKLTIDIGYRYLQYINLVVLKYEDTFAQLAHICSTGSHSKQLECQKTNPLTLFHHADVNAAFETTGLAVTAVVLGDGAASVEWTGEGGFTLHAASIEFNC